MGASHFTFHCNVCQMWQFLKLFTEITNSFGNRAYYKQFPNIHFQNTYTEIAQLLDEGECKVCTVTNVRRY